jgi:hypothetical protein
LENTGTTHIYSSTGLIYKQDFWVSPFSSVHFSSSLPVPLPTDDAPSPSLLSLPISLSLPTAPLPTVGAPLPHPSLSLSSHAHPVDVLQRRCSQRGSEAALQWVPAWPCSLPLSLTPQSRCSQAGGHAPAAWTRGPIMA